MQYEITDNPEPKIPNYQVPDPVGKVMKSIVPIKFSPISYLSSTAQNQSIMSRNSVLIGVGHADVSAFLDKNVYTHTNTHIPTITNLN